MLAYAFALRRGLYALIVFLIGGFLFAGKRGGWITLKVVIQGLFIFILLPVGLLLYGTFWMNKPAPVDPRRATFDVYYYPIHR